MLRCRVPSRARARPTVRPTARRYTTAPARDAPAAAAASPSTTPQLFDAEYFQKRRRGMDHDAYHKLHAPALPSSFALIGIV